MRQQGSSRLFTLKHAAFASRVIALVFGLAALSLIALSLAERDWMDGFSLYILTVACLNCIVVWIPPYPDLVLDGFFTTAWALCTIFALLLTILKSTCYGIANVDPENTNATSCSKYRSMVVACFITFLSWFICVSLVSGQLRNMVYLLTESKSLMQYIRVIYANWQDRKRLRKATSGSSEEGNSGALLGQPMPSIIPRNRADFHDARASLQAANQPMHHHADQEMDPEPVEDKKSVEDRHTPDEVLRDSRGSSKKTSVRFSSDIPSIIKPSHVRTELKLLPVKIASPMPETTDRMPQPPSEPPIGMVEIEHIERKRSEASEKSMDRADDDQIMLRHAYPDDHCSLQVSLTKYRGLFANIILAYWPWVCLAGSILVIVALPILIVYAVPALAIYIVDHIALPDAATVTFREFNEHDLLFNISTRIKVPLTIKAVLDPADLMLYDPELPGIRPIAHLHTSRMIFRGGHQIAASNQSLTIGDADVWAGLWKKFFFHEKFGLGVFGKLHVKVGPLKTHVNVNRVFPLKGIIPASALALDYIYLTPPDEDGCTIRLKVNLTDPTPLEIDSQAKFEANVLIGGALLAKAYIDPFALLRGNTSITAKAKVDSNILQSLTTNLGSLLGAELPYVTDGWAALTVQGAKITQFGTAWPYWIAGAQGILLPVGVKFDSPAFGQFVSNLVANMLSGKPLFGTAMNGTTQVDVSAINKLLQDILIVDSTTINS